MISYMMKITAAILLTASLFLSGCATIFSSRETTTQIDSTPSRLAYRIMDVQGTVVSQGITPSSATLDRSPGYFRAGSYTIEVTRKGKVVGKETITASLNNWYFGNILIGGLIGMVIVDPLTGAMYRMPENVTISTIDMTSAATESRSFQIIDLSTLNRQQRSSLVRI